MEIRFACLRVKDCSRLRVLLLDVVDVVAVVVVDDSVAVVDVVIVCVNKFLYEAL